MKKMIILRRLSQAFFLTLFIYILWSTTYPLGGIILPDAIFKADPLIMIMVSMSEKILLPGFVISLVMIVASLIIGRFFCGWVCPMGTTIDIIASAKKHNAVMPDTKSAILRKPKFYFMGIFFILALIGWQVAWVADPLVLAARFVSMNMIPSLTYLFNAFFIFLIRDCNIQGVVKDLYYAMKPTVLGVKAFYFAHSLVIFSFFAVICAIALVIPRLWCRSLCPLGAIYSLIGRFSPFRRKTYGCISCGKCHNSCRMGAIKEDFSYSQGECILCMDCIYDCPSHVTKFSFTATPSANSSHVKKDSGNSSKISRKNFILLIFSSFFAMGSLFRKKGRGNFQAGAVIRPPAALEEEDFVNRCIRCGNCMKVCITNGLQPVMFQAGAGGIWTPQLLPEAGYCEYQCTLCGHTCPTGAIPSLSREKKMKVKLGLAEIDQSICLPWAKHTECLVCQEHCPVADKAIKLNTYGGGPAKPYIDEDLCVGCGICQNKCPVRPERAIKVNPARSDRTKA
ncbi:MAG: 4Fe-4S binding protein [Candidatus Omnitrophota bacterium]